MAGKQTTSGQRLRVINGGHDVECTQKACQCKASAQQRVKEYFPPKSDESSAKTENPNQKTEKTAKPTGSAQKTEEPDGDSQKTEGAEGKPQKTDTAEEKSQETPKPDKETGPTKAFRILDQCIKHTINYHEDFAKNKPTVKYQIEKIYGEERVVVVLQFQEFLVLEEVGDGEMDSQEEGTVHYRDTTLREAYVGTMASLDPSCQIKNLYWACEVVIQSGREIGDFENGKHDLVDLVRTGKVNEIKTLDTKIF